METLTDYKLKEFLQLKDESRIRDSLFILEALKPLKTIDNPKHKVWNKEPAQLQLKNVRFELSFGEVTLLRTLFNNGSPDAILQGVSLVTGLEKDELLELRISQFYGVLAAINDELLKIHSLEVNELSDEIDDPLIKRVEGKERMSKFSTFNILDSLANGDVLRWSEIEKLPYMQVFTKLKMDRERSLILHEINEIQKRNAKVK